MNHEGSDTAKQENLKVEDIFNEPNQTVSAPIAQQ